MPKEVDSVLQTVLDSLKENNSIQRRKSLRGNDLYNRITQLIRVRDAQIGINSYFIDGCMVRDARYIKPQAFQAENDENAISYLTIGLNYTAALAALLESRAEEQELKGNKFKFDSKKLIELADNFVRGALNNRSIVPALLGYNRYFYIYLQQMLAPICVATGLATDLASAIKVLDKAKDWVALEQKPIAIATVDHFISGITRLPKLIVRLEKPVCALTAAQKTELVCALPTERRLALLEKMPELKKEIETYKATLTPEERSTLGFANHKPVWYLNLEKKNAEDHELDLFFHYLPQILEGRVIPSQLRSRLPLLKNASQHSTSVVEPKVEYPSLQGKIPELDDSTPYTVRTVVDNFQSGALTFCHKSATPNEAEIKRIAKQNMLQLKQHAEKLPGYADKEIHCEFITLSSRYGDSVRSKIEWAKDFWRRLKKLFSVPSIPYYGFDRHIVEKTQNAADELGFYASNICLNGFRRFESPSYGAIMHIYREAENLIKILNESQKATAANAIAKKLYLLRNEMGSFQFILAKLRTQTHFSFTDYILRGVLSVIEPFHRFFNYLLVDRERVAGIRMIALFSQLIQQIKRINEECNIKNSKIFIENDNCASGENRTNLARFVKDCEAVIAGCPDLFPEEIKLKLAASRHAPKIQGGNPGQDGVRAKSIKSLPESYAAVAPILVTKYSDKKSATQDLAKEAKNPQKTTPGVYQVSAEDYREWFGKPKKMIKAVSCKKGKKYDRDLKTALAIVDMMVEDFHGSTAKLLSQVGVMSKRERHCAEPFMNINPALSVKVR